MADDVRTYLLWPTHLNLEDIIIEQWVKMSKEVFQRFLDDAFNPHAPLVPTPTLLKRLQQLGGIQPLIKHLTNIQSSTLSQQKSKNHSHLLQSLLLYLMTLSLCSKLLLFHSQEIESLQIVRECFAIVLLTGVIVMKRRALGPLKERQSLVSKVAAEKIIIRGGQYLQVDENGVQPGDIIQIEENTLLVSDGILLKVNKSCSEDEEQQTSILVMEKGKKDQNSVSTNVIKTVYDQCCMDLTLDSTLDPFLYHETTVLQGEGLMLVCKVNRRPQKLQEYKELEEGLLGLWEMRKVVFWLKLFILLPIAIFWNQWYSTLDEEDNSYDAFLFFIAMMASLLLYLSYLNEDYALQRLSLFYFECQDGPSCTLTHPKALEELSRVDIFLLEERQYGGKEQSLSLLSLFHNIKVLTDKSKSQILKGFAQQLCPYTVYEQNEGLPLRERMKLLLGAKFIASDNKEANAYYLKLLTQMGYSVLAVSCYTDQLARMDYYTDQKKEEWGRNKIGFRVLDVLPEMEAKSCKVAKLKDCYITIIVNSCLQVLMLIYWACQGTIVGLNFNLIVLYINRNAASDLVERWTGFSSGWGLRRPLWLWYNAYLFFYYLFIMREISTTQEDKSFLLFLLMVVNRLFRTEALKPILSLSRVFAKIGMLFLVMVCEVGVRYYTTKEVRVVSEWLAILAMPVIVAIFRKWGRGVH